MVVDFAQYSIRPLAEAIRQRYTYPLNKIDTFPAG